jgi:hypothetical protein
MLKAVVQHSRNHWGRDKMRDDLTWLIDRAISLEDKRNDAIHAPLFAVNKSIYGEMPASEPIAPAWWLKNPRAKALSESKNLLGQFKYCRDTAITLSDYAKAIDGALVNPQRTWPKRPSLPEKQPKKAPQDHTPPLIPK